MRFLYKRHGESIGNTMSFPERTLYEIANHDFPLTERGRAQSQQAGVLLKSRIESGEIPKITKVFVSPMLRARESFECMGLSVPHVVDPRLSEWWKGVWHASLREEMHRAYPLEKGLAEKYGWYFHRPPGGESFMDAHVRVLGFVESLKPWDSEDCFLIVAHGRLLKAFEMALGVISDPSQVFTEAGLVEVPNASISEYQYCSDTKAWALVE